MAKSTFSYLFLFISVANCIQNVYTNEYVPVFLYGSLSKHIAVPALTKLSKNEFRSMVLPQITEDVFTVVFQEETLSIEDLSCVDESGKSCFNFLKAQREDVDTKFSYLPAVNAPVSALHNIPASNEPVIRAKLTPNGLKVHKEDGAKIMFLSLEDGIVFDDRQKMLAVHDAFIAEKVRELEEEHDNKVVVIYTAKHSSWQVPEAVRHTRSLLAEEPKDIIVVENGTLYTGGENQLLFYVTGVSVNYFQEEAVDLKFTTTELTVNETTNELVFQLKQDAEYQLDLTFEIGGGYWALSEAIFAKGTDTPSSLRVADINGLAGFSYHCDPVIQLKNENVTVSITGLQVQPFSGNTTGGVFGEALDCVGFMSIPILSGLFVTLLLGAIISLGICMMMDLKTMDRFEDPKGKTITVTASD